jgi:hypothetical protein
MGKESASHAKESPQKAAATSKSVVAKSPSKPKAVIYSPIKGKMSHAKYLLTSDMKLLLFWFQNANNVMASTVVQVLKQHHSNGTDGAEELYTYETKRIHKSGEAMVNHRGFPWECFVIENEHVMTEEEARSKVIHICQVSI